MMAVPRVSVFTASKNGARFLRETIESIHSQSFKDHEHVIVDGASTDETVEILRAYPHVRWISEPDSSAEEGFHKAVRMCRGEYLFQCCVSDGFLDPTWFATCVDVLDRDPEVSLVYGVQRNMSEDGQLHSVAYQELLSDPPPQKTAFLPFWLATRFHFPETNYCVRRRVFLECFPSQASTDYFDRENPFLKFIYAFNSTGYLPFFLPVVANFYRTHKSQLTETALPRVLETNNLYDRLVHDYALKLFREGHPHLFRNGGGQTIEHGPSGRLGQIRRRTIRYACSRGVYFGTSESIFSSLVPLSTSEKTTIRAHRAAVLFRRAMSSVKRRLVGPSWRKGGPDK